MIELAVLGLLKEQPMYGYELKKQLEHKLGHTWKLSFGSLYPTLTRLSKQGAVEVQDTAAATRRKKVYRITPSGEALFDRLIEESGASAAEDREAFMLRLAFFRYTKPETRRRLIERRRGYLLDSLAKITETLKRLSERMDAWSLQLMEYEKTEVERGIRWLDTMLEAERAAEKPKRKRADRKAARRQGRVAAGVPRSRARKDDRGPAAAEAIRAPEPAAVRGETV